MGDCYEHVQMKDKIMGKLLISDIFVQCLEHSELLSFKDMKDILSFSYFLVTILLRQLKDEQQNA